MKRLVLTLIGLMAVGMAHAQTISEQYLLQAANTDRAAHGLSPVALDPRLVTAARLHAYEMAKRGTISHQFEGEMDLATRAGEAGAKFSLITENVAEANNSALIHDLWMHSAGHRANLLDPKVTVVGIAVVQNKGQLYAVEDFGRAVETLTLDQQESKVAGMLAGEGLRLAHDKADARQTCAMSTGYAGRQPWFVMRYTSADIGQLPPELVERVGTGKYHEAAVGACITGKQTSGFTSYNLAILLYP